MSAWVSGDRDTGCLRLNARTFWAGELGVFQEEAAWMLRRRCVKEASVVVAVASRKSLKMPVR